MEFNMAGGGHTELRYNDEVTHTPASAHAIRAESVSPQCDPRLAAGALCMNCHRPRSH